jgi:hypothetical protein
VRAPIVKRGHFHVLDIPATVWPLEFDSQIRELHVAIEERQIVLVRPLLDLPCVTVRSPVGVRTIAITLVEKALILAFQLMVEDDAMDADVGLLESFDNSLIRGMQLCVVRQLARADVA